MRVSNIKIKDRILLKKAARNGCSESLAAIYEKYQPMICDFLHKSGADGIAEDICQSVFILIAEGKCKYDGSSEPKSYLFGVATNTYKNDLKADKVATYGLSPVDIDGDLLVQESARSCPLESLQAAEYSQFLMEGMAELSSKANQAITLVFIEGMLAKDAAKAIGCDFKIFRKRLDYGLRCLRKGENIH